MKKTAIFGISIIFFILAAAMAMAVPPFIQAESAGSIGIAYPQTPYLLANNGEVTFHFHVFNSTGYPLTAPTTNCTVHVYNSTHAHVLEVVPVPMDSNGLDYRIVLGTNITHVPQTYSYIIQCTNTKEAGWIESVFTISTEQSDISYLPVIYGLLALLTVCVVVGLVLDSVHAPFKMFLIWLSFGILALIINFVQQYAITSGAGTVIMSVITTTLYVTILLVTIASVYFMIYFLTTMMKLIQTAALSKKWWNKKDGENNR